MCEIRFKLNSSDGKLYNMVNKIDKDIRTEVVKEAMLHYFRNVRDGKVESNYISASLFNEFNENIQPNSFTMNDVFRLLESRPATQVVAPTPVYHAPAVEDEYEDEDDEYEYTEEDVDESVDVDEDDVFINDEDIF